MKWSLTSLRRLDAAKCGHPSGVFTQTTSKSTVAKSSLPSGKRPVPTPDQVKKLEQVGRELVDAAVLRRKEHAVKAWEKASLDEKRKMMDKEVQDLLRPNKPKSLERLKFEGLEAGSGYVTLTASVPTLDDLNRPKPGAFVELRR